MVVVCLSSVFCFPPPSSSVCFLIGYCTCLWLACASVPTLCKTFLSFSFSSALGARPSLLCLCLGAGMIFHFPLLVHVATCFNPCGAASISCLAPDQAWAAVRGIVKQGPMFDCCPAHLYRRQGSFPVFDPLCLATPAPSYLVLSAHHSNNTRGAAAKERSTLSCACRFCY